MLPIKNNNKDTVTGAHKQPAFAAEGSGVTVGWQGSIEMPSGAFLMNIYIDRPDMTRHFIGQTKVDTPSIVHSFGVTKNYAVLVAPSLELDIKSVPLSVFKPGSNFSGLSIIKWRADKKAAAYVFDMHSTDPEKPPVRTFELDPMYFNHHVNAWEQDGEIIMDLVGYSDGSFISNPHGFGHVEVEKDAQAREKIAATQAQPELRRYRLNMDTKQSSLKADFEHLMITDAVNGFNYRIEMPRFNERAHRGQSYCHVFAMSSHIQHDHDSLPNIVKADLCNNGTAIEWYEENHYPSEPIFVPRPGAVDEDDGVVLAVTLDGPRALTYLLVLDGKTMQTLAKAYSPVFQPYDVHGQFFPDASMYAPVEVLV
jgi:beta-carotene 15,15'-monooxygenase